MIFLLKRFGEVLTGDPNTPVGRLGPPIPPLYSCKKLESSLKKAVPTIPWFNPNFTAKSQFPFSKADESTPFLGKKIQIKESVKKCKISPKVQSSVLLRQAPGLRIRKCGSVAGPGIKIRTKVVRIRVPSPYPSKDGRIRTPDFSLSLTFL